MDMWSADTPRPSRRLWFALLGAPVAWGLQGLLGWLISEERCLGAQQHAAAAEGLRALDMAISAVALSIGIAALLSSIRIWRCYSDSELSSPKTMDRMVFMRAVAIFVSASFTLGILWMSFGSLWLPGCERMR